jgi:GNAT superfamily N-acetyltransferase
MSASTPVHVRDAAQADGPELLRLARAFYDAALADGGIPFDETSAARNFLAMIGQRLLLVAEVGGAVVGVVGGAAGPHLCNESYYVGTEVLWWVDPSHRKTGAGLALLDAIEARAKAIGVSKWVMLDLVREGSDDRARMIYEQRGYRLRERAYQKDLQ